jgi:Fe-S cluster biogenesis protein NfuA
MLIETEDTPNPETLKFLPQCAVSPARSWQFEKLEDAEGRSPLAMRLLKILGVSRVFLGSDFISVTKQVDKPWALVRPAVLGALLEHFSANLPIVTEDGPAEVRSAQADRNFDDDTKQIVAEIEELLETRVRPAVAQDGGDIRFHDFDKDSGVVWLEMRGACSGCPSSTATLKMGIENMLKHFIPEITEVRAA